MKQAVFTCFLVLLSGSDRWEYSANRYCAYCATRDFSCYPLYKKGQVYRYRHSCNNGDWIANSRPELIRYKENCSMFNRLLH